MTWPLALIALLLPWCTGVALLYCAAALSLPRAIVHAPGERCWRLGAGAFLGYWLTTLLMRAYSAIHIPFSFLAIALPLLIITVAAGLIAWRRAPWQRSTNSCDVCALSKLARWAFIALCGWVALRFGLLFFEVATRPLFPWEASLQWASKAHVYFGLKSLAPFTDSATWLSTPDNIYFDNAPMLPATLPLLQAWMCIAIGEWNDVLMNLPWWAMLLALTLAIYGFMRTQGGGPLISLIAAWLVSSLPLLNTHVALAGLPDLPLAGVYTVTALALVRWARSREWLDLGSALLFALVAASLWAAAYVWLVALVPALIASVYPKATKHAASASLVFYVLGLLILMQAGKSLFATPNLSFDFSIDAWTHVLLLENWHFLWPVTIITFLIAWKSKSPDFPQAVLFLVALNVFLFSLALISAPNLAHFFHATSQIERALLIATPLLVCSMIFLFIKSVHKIHPLPSKRGGIHPEPRRLTIR